MEPKIIKEENVDKEVSSFVDLQQRTTRNSNKTVAGPSPKARSKTPDSPESQPLPSSSPTQSSPSRTTNTNTATTVSPPLPAQTSSTPQNGCSTPPPPPPPTTQLVTTSSNFDQPQQQQYINPYTGRPLVKLKRFLGTLVQFGQEIGPEVGDKVRNLVLSLVSSTLSIEEFHSSLQDVTNFPLRPFVLPFLKAHLPPLQREVQTLARAAKQTPLQYLRSHDHVVLEAVHFASEPCDIFLPSGAAVSAPVSGDSAPGSTNAMTAATSAAHLHPLKRRALDNLFENGFPLQNIHDVSISSASESALSSNVNATAVKRPYNNLLLTSQHSGHPVQLFDYTQHGHFYSSSAGSGSHLHRPDDCVDTTTNSSIPSRNSSQHPPQQATTQLPIRVDEEWRNIHVMLNCILSMVEKTKRALTILQQRTTPEHPITTAMPSTVGDYFRRHDITSDLKKAAAEIIAHAVRQTEDRVADVRRRAEEAVNDVKRQAVVELQKAVAAAELKATELVANERAKMEKLLVEARKQSEETNNTNHVDSGENSQSPPIASQPAPSQQNSCWNCGRKAHETCSGCGVARYCGPFCQHKDWENHHQVCCGSRDNKSRPQRTTTPVATSATAATVSTALIPDTIRLKK